eukprot:PLAT3553.20.p1 GENE.PLAT3553.20~~PLAT3553.20.p1  ORF type:complete len:512 (-),score=231.83 PLAT3553.20:133-1668(-)
MADDWMFEDSDEEDGSWGSGDGHSDEEGEASFGDGELYDAHLESGPAALAEEWRVLRPADVEEEVNALVDDLAGVLDLPRGCAGVLLRAFQWNKEKLIDAYYADSDAVCSEAGCSARGAAYPTAKKASASAKCTICTEDVDSSALLGMGCGHAFCMPCWRQYLSVAVSDGPSCVFTQCPSQKCKEVVDDSFFARVLEADDLERYSFFLRRSFVDMNKRVKWCPSPRGCENAIEGSGGTLTVHCSCGFSFCFRCLEEDHAPASCSDVAEWFEKCRNESETAHWILANTKLCPRCPARIEKNQGCNHMVCRSCRHEFCWLCLGDWEEHGATTGGFYRCNRYDPSRSSGADSSGGGSGGGGGKSAAEAKKELDRYLHYYQRFHNHEQARKFAEKSLVETEKRMVRLHEATEASTWIDVQFLKTAADVLIECRQVLKFTYVHAYYLPMGKEKDLFEYLQEDLERNTERLAELSEMDLDKLERETIINQTRVTQRFLRNLIVGVEEGLTAAGGDHK